MKNKMVNSRKGLQPLEFEECIVDSPEFRENLNRHEKELDHTSQQIKRIIKEVRELVSAAKVLSQKQRTLAKSLKEFNFECIGSAQTDDEQVISDSLRHFGKLIENIEDERDNMLQLAHEQIIEPLEDFRKKQIGGVKENKKKFDKKTEKFCQSQERFLNMSTKKPENTIQEADASLGMHEREYIQESLSYVLRIQEVQERIKFEFVEILLAFISGWLVFYHAAHDKGEDDKDYLTDLRHRVQKTRESFEETREKVNELKSKYMEKKAKPEEKFTKRGYLFLMEKKPFKATWSKYYCTYKKQEREFTMLQFNQISSRSESQTEVLTLKSCIRRTSEFEKRFCFDLLFDEKPGITYTFQALSEEDRKAWINAMDGAEPTYLAPGKSKGTEEYQLDEVGFLFVRKCIEVLESRGLEDEGLYRKSGVGTKISRLLALGMDRKKTELVFSDEQYKDLMESNTIASALKTYLRNLSEPLMTYRYHSGFIAAAKQETRRQRVNDVHTLVHRLPKANFEMLDIVIKHLTEVAKKYEKNKMSVFNLGVVFGPTLLRPVEETVAAILDIKFNNIVINILIDHYDLIFRKPPGAVLDYTNSSPPARMPRAHQSNKHSSGNRPMYSPQQQVYRVVAKSNYTDQPMSSSLQSIPNGLVYHNSSNSGPNSAIVSSSNNSAASKTVCHPIKSPQQMSHMTLSESDISIRRDPAYLSASSSILPTGGSAQLNVHHAPLSNNDFLMSSLQSHPVSHSYVNNRDRMGHNSNVNNLSPPTGSNSGRNHGSSVYGLSPHSRHLVYGGSASHYQSRDSNDRVHSTSSSNESVCDSISSNRGGGTDLKLLSAGGGSSSSSRIPSGRSGSYGTAPSLPPLVGGASCDDDYVPKKSHRSKDINQIKSDLDAGTARVRTLYACLGENEGELSFEPNQIITNVRFSKEPGWLQGTLNGKTGLIPENYVEHLKPYN